MGLSVGTDLPPIMPLPPLCGGDLEDLRFLSVCVFIQEETALADAAGLVLKAIAEVLQGGARSGRYSLLLVASAILSCRQ